MKLSIESLADVVASAVLLDAIETSHRLTKLKVPHALIGGLAIGLHGHPRATKDVDFLVGPQAFSSTEPILLYRKELAELARVGEIDLMGIPDGHDELLALLELPKEGEIPVLPLPPLIYLKLAANRPQDRADVFALLKRGADLREIRDYLLKFAPELVSKLAEVASDLESSP